MCDCLNNEMDFVMKCRDIVLQIQKTTLKIDEKNKKSKKKLVFVRSSECWKAKSDEKRKKTEQKCLNFIKKITIARSRRYRVLGASHEMQLFWLAGIVNDKKDV